MTPCEWLWTAVTHVQRRRERERERERKREINREREEGLGKEKAVKTKCQMKGMNKKDL